MRACLLELARQRLPEDHDRLAAHAEALARGSKCDEPRVRTILAAGRLAQCGLDAVSLGTDAGEPRLCLGGEAPVVGGEDRVGAARALGGLAVRGGGIPCGGRSGSGCLLERADRLVAAAGHGTFRFGQLIAQPGREAGCRLAPEREALARTLQTVERAQRRLPPARGVGQLVFGALPLLEQRGQLLLRASPRNRDRVAPRLGVGPALGDGLEVELRDPRPQRSDLDRELLGALGGRRLKSQRPQPLADLLLDILRALDLRRDAGELELGAVPTTLELAEPGGLLDEMAPVLRSRRKDSVDLSLRDDRVHRPAEADIGEQFDEVGAAHSRLVDEVLALAAAHEPARDRDLAEVDLVAEAAVAVVEEELHLAVVGGLARRGAAEEDVVRLLGAQL